jgi:hypothetical protein
MAKLRKKIAPASLAEDAAEIEARTAAMVEETKAIEAEIRAKAKVAGAEAETRELEKEAQVDADPSAELVRATSAEETIFQKTTADISNATPVATAEEIEQLDRKINSVALSIVGEFQGRVETELLPLLYRMRSILPHGQWGKWYAGFCERHRIQWSIRSVQRKFKQLEDGWKEGPTRINKSKNAAVVEAGNLLADAKVQFGKSAEDGNEEAKAIIADYEKRHSDAVAQADATVDATAKPSAEMRVNKRLAAIAEAGERYIRVMARVIYSDSVTLTDRQQHDLEKASEQWNKCLRDARELSWAVKVIEGQTA